MLTVRPFPQETIDAIEDEIEENEKALQLAGSSWSPFCAWSSRLTESPYPVKYIHFLRIEFGRVRALTPSDLENLPRLLAQLTSVRNCKIDGSNDGGTIHRGELPPAISSGLIHFISQQELGQLHLCHLGVPPAVLLIIQKSTRALSVHLVSHDSDAADVPGTGPPQTSARSLDCLIVHISDPQIFEILSTPHFPGQLVNLHRLSVEHQYSVRLISGAAHALESPPPRMHSYVHKYPSHPLTDALQNLKCPIEIMLAVWSYTAPWVIDMGFRILASLDVPLIHWDYSTAANIAVLSAVEQLNMPMLHAMGKLKYEMGNHNGMNNFLAREKGNLDVFGNLKLRI
ncbi:hypothetical protein DFH09DRAFT_1339604 [Mycena vulgaris]|nr:hypothetical protein DFH09DRAFT_1339604 [Mycena vulgaris]